MQFLFFNYKEHCLSKEQVSSLYILPRFGSGVIQQHSYYFSQAYYYTNQIIEIQKKDYSTIKQCFKDYHIMNVYNFSEDMRFHSETKKQHYLDTCMRSIYSISTVLKHDNVPLLNEPLGCRPSPKVKPNKPIFNINFSPEIPDFTIQEENVFSMNNLKLFKNQKYTSFPEQLQHYSVQK